MYERDTEGLFGYIIKNVFYILIGICGGFTVLFGCADGFRYLSSDLNDTDKLLNFIFYVPSGFTTCLYVIYKLGLIKKEHSKTNRLI